MDRELALAGIDLQDLMQRLMGNTTLVRVVIKKFVADPTYQKLLDAMDAGDMKGAEMACHSLKGMCGNLSLKELFELFQEQLKYFRTGEPAKAVAMQQQIAPLYAMAIAHMNAWLEQ